MQIFEITFACSRRVKIRANRTERKLQAREIKIANYATDRACVPAPVK